MIRNLWPRVAVLSILLICALGLSSRLQAQQAGQATPPANSQTPPATPQTESKPATDPVTVQRQPAPAPQTPQNDRILWALPNYLTVENASSLPPLTSQQKFKLVAQGTFDPLEIAFIGGEALVYQAANTNPSFGQGFKGYAKRYGLAFTDNAIENFMTSSVFASAFRQDPRYYQLGKGSFLHRAGYAALRVVLTRGDSGKTQFNFSELVGAGAAAGISNAYHPGPQTLRSAVHTWGTQMGWDAVGFELKEFWPDIHRYLRHAKHNNM